MKKTIQTLAIVTVLAAGPAMQASAINREWSAALGFLGGLMVANGGLCPRTVVSEPIVVQQPVYIERPVYSEPMIVEEPVVRGHYEYHARKIWTPGYWECIVTPCGREERVWREGYYRTEMIKVWVDDGPRRECRGHRR